MVGGQHNLSTYWTGHSIRKGENHGSKLRGKI